MNLPFPELHWAGMGSRGEEAHSFCIWVIPGTWRHGETGWHSDSDPDCLGLCPSTITYKWCDLGQVT